MCELVMLNFRPRRVLQTPQIWSLEQIGSPTRRAQFEAGRWLLHHAAREAFGGANYRVELRDERPVVTVEGASAPAAVSLSHTGDYVLCGIAASGLLGVDVELVRPRKQWEGIAEFALHPAERRRLSGLPDRDLWPAFYRLWTLKEALAKALGVGLAMPFSDVCLSDEARIEEAPVGHGLTERAWNLRPLEAPTGMAAAVAWSEGSV
jgi:4'-phosphopantetheinyl transferase